MKKKSSHEKKIELLNKEIEILKLQLELLKTPNTPSINTWPYRHYVDLCLDGHVHSYPFIWNGTQPPTCLKCGKPATPNFTITSQVSPQDIEFIQNGITTNDKITIKS